MKSGQKFYGLYRATVVNNVDPMLQGRIMVIVPDVGSVTPSTFVNPCVPMAGKQQGTFMVPQMGSMVWIQFEGGDPDKPVWMGGAWPDPAFVPTAALAPVAYMLVSSAFHRTRSPCSVLASSNICIAFSVKAGSSA